MIRKMLRHLSLGFITLVGVFTFIFSFEGETNAAHLTLNSIDDLKIDTVDGETYSPDKHQNIAGIVVKMTDQGERILGFSSLEKYEDYQQQMEKRVSIASISTTASKRSWFYEHTSNHNHGSGLPLYPGESITFNSGYYYSWNDRISAVGIAPNSWVRLYRDVNYRGPWISFENHSYSQYKYVNLTSFAGWNDQTSSITTGKYN